MSGNSFGQFFRITTFGESHGDAIGVVIDSVPSNLQLNIADIQHELNRRKPGQSAITTQRKESDQVEILSGVFEGVTTGTPIALLIRNTDHRSNDYDQIKNVFRPGHADYGYFAKFGIRDYRGGGRASGRETAARVAAGAIAKKILSQKGISIYAYTLAVAGIYAQKIDFSVIEKNIVRSPDLEQAEFMIQAIQQASQNQDSVGGIVEATVLGVPAGLGNPVFDKLDALLAHALMSIGSVKGIEIGDGFLCATQTGASYNDPFYNENNVIKTKTNHCGGILGGISTGMPIVLRCAIRPTPTISTSQQTVTETADPTTIEVHGRHDPCICPRIVPVVESMIAITLLDTMLSTSH